MPYSDILQQTATCVTERGIYSYATEHILNPDLAGTFSVKGRKFFSSVDDKPMSTRSSVA